MSLVPVEKSKKRASLGDETGAQKRSKIKDDTVCFLLFYFIYLRKIQSTDWYLMVNRMAY